MYLRFMYFRLKTADKYPRIRVVLPCQKNLHFELHFSLHLTFLTHLWGSIPPSSIHLDWHWKYFSFGEHPDIQVAPPFEHLVQASEHSNQFMCNPIGLKEILFVYQ